MPWSLYAGEGDPPPTVYGLRGPPGQSGQVQKISPLPGFDPWNVQPVVSYNTSLAIPNCPPNNTASSSSSQTIYNVSNTTMRASKLAKRVKLPCRWKSREHKEYWQSICGQRQAKGFL